jgi:RNA polymerase sigma factor (TIGR02999 family)
LLTRNRAVDCVIRSTADGTTRDTYRDMATADTATVSQLLQAWSAGDLQARDDLVPLVYDELRRRAAACLRGERRDHTLQPTALVNEAYLRLMGQHRTAWRNRAQFFAVSARMMRRILVDHARTKHRKKRGGKDRIRLQLREDHAFSMECPEEILFVDEVLEKLVKLDPLHARILEYRLFGGLSMKEIGEVLGVCSRTVERHWAMVRAWFLREAHIYEPEEEPEDDGFSGN